jgi:DUF438 domain-containing protein
MSELINNSSARKELLKHMILQLHEGLAPEAVKQRLLSLLQKIPYGEVVEVEQELISEGLPQEEVLRLCDAHTQALEGAIDQSGAREVPDGHPVDVFLHENMELTALVRQISLHSQDFNEHETPEKVKTFFNKLKGQFNLLMDVDKHYRRKENLLFPFLEKYGITGPPTVMWGKHDQTRELLRSAIEVLNSCDGMTGEEFSASFDLVFQPALAAVTDMIMKEEEILFPMCMDKLTDVDWLEIQSQTLEIGYCLYDPDVIWKPEGIETTAASAGDSSLVQLFSGSFAPEELQTILNMLPVDITFVDRNDKVKYFSQGKERIFDRNRAILGRDVRMCHPPSSVHVVEKILEDFKSGKSESAPFWIQMRGRFIHIEYFALRGPDGEYLGTLEVSQDLTEKRKLDGEKRILS